MNWEEVQALANVVLVLTSAGAIGYAALQLRHEREYRSVNNLEKQLSFFLGEGFLSSRQRLSRARVDIEGDALRPLNTQEPPVSAFEVLDFYDHLGLLIKKGHLSLYDVWHTFYEFMQPVYIDLQPLIEGSDSPYYDHYSHLRHLMRGLDEIQLKRMHARNANHWALWTPDRILDHYRYELEVDEEARNQRRARLRGRKPGTIPHLESSQAEVGVHHPARVQGVLAERSGEGISPAVSGRKETASARG